MGGDIAPCEFEQIANKYNAEIIEHKEFIGGRYSVLSESGMLPAALMGLEVNRFKNLKILNGLVKRGEQKKGLRLPALTPYNFYYWCTRLSRTALFVWHFNPLSPLYLHYFPITHNGQL